MHHRFHFRKTFSCWLVTAALGCFLLTGICAAAHNEEFPGESAKWHSYQSPHFELFSAVREKKSRELLHQLELLRALFFETLKLKERQPLPVTVYYFANAKDFKAYAPVLQRQALGGYYMDHPDRAVIAITPVWDAEWARHIVFHEFVHHLNRAVGSTPPLWYDEGLAELFSTITFKPDGVILGMHLPWHVESLKQQGLLPLETVFTMDAESPAYNNGKHSGQFYAESWALLHYLRYGENNLDKGKVGELLDYFFQESPGTDSTVRRQVFKETIGISYLELRKRLDEYLRKGRFYSYKAKLPQVPDSKSYEKRLMSREEIRLGLAELSLRVNQSADARLHLLQVVEQDPKNFRCWEALGSDASNRGETDVAQERWQRALASGSTSPAIFHELGQMEGRRWFETFDYNFRMPEARTRELRALLKRSIECTPDQNDGYELLAWVEASAIKPDPGNIDLAKQHFKTLPARTRAMLAFALVHARAGDRATALKLLDQIDRVKPDYWAASAAETIRAKLEDRAPRKIDRPVETTTPPPRIRMRMPELLQWDER